LHVGVVDDESPGEREGQIGANFGVIVKYQALSDLGGKYQYLVKQYLDGGKDVVLVIEFLDGGYSNLQQIIDGAFDGQLNGFIDDMMSHGNQQMWIRHLHEFNGDWYPWGTYRDGNDTDTFKRAFRHVVDVFRGRGANVKFQLAYNCDNPNDDGKSFHDWYPGGDVVDMILCSGYNRAGVDSDHTSWQSFSEVFSSGYYKMASLDGGKPLGVAETSSTSWGGDKAQWIRDAFDAVVNQFTRVEQCNWFLINKAGDWDLNSDSERHAFGDSLNEYSW
ncbi:glycoside hydrolase superfamily, partial [Tribonema minus]